MIARIDDADEFAISRTYLRADGSGKADLPEKQQKLMLGTAAGGHVALRTDDGPHVVAEGIETALSLPHLWDLEGEGEWHARKHGGPKRVRHCRSDQWREKAHLAHDRSRDR